MAISSLVPPAVESTTKTFTATTSNTLYFASTDFEPGIYRITCVTSSVAVMEFYASDQTIILTATTVSGTVDINLATAANLVSFRTNTGSTVLVNVTLIGNVVSSTAPSGTLDTITTSGTYNTTGRLWVLAIGGGGGGGSAPGSGNAGAAGGGGGIAAGGNQTPNYYITTTASTVTIGAGGNSFNVRSTNANASANLGYAPNANAGGSTIFGNLTSAGGAAGGVASNNVNSNPGIPGGSGFGMNSAGGAANIATPWLKTPGTNGGGGGGGDNNNGTGQSGGGSGIGTGGTGGGTTTTATAGTGYGAGGGGSGSIGANDRIPGGAGTQGVVYVLRGMY